MRRIAVREVLPPEPVPEERPAASITDFANHPRRKGTEPRFALDRLRTLQGGARRPRAPRLSDETVAAILGDASAGVSITDLCRQHGIADSTFYRWRQSARDRGVDTAPVAAADRARVAR